MSLRNVTRKHKCGHENQFHVSWGGYPHYHGPEKRERVDEHSYCMPPDCDCRDVKV